MNDRPIFKGGISLGSFLIPIRIVKATKQHDVRFHEYHATDFGRVGRSKPCKVCGEVLTEDSIIKGIEVSKGNVITFTKDELASLPVQSTKTIEIDRFVSAEELNPLFFDSAYFVLPEEIGVKAFELFVKGLKKERKVAIGKIAMRQRENICAIAPHGNGLLLNTLHYSDEVRDMPSVQKAQTVDDEVELISQVIKKYSKPFEHSIYNDSYTEAIQMLIDAKLKGETITTVDSRREEVCVEDALRELLRGENETK